MRSPPHRRSRRARMDPTDCRRQLIGRCAHPVRRRCEASPLHRRPRHRTHEYGDRAPACSRSLAARSKSRSVVSSWARRLLRRSTSTARAIAPISSCWPSAGISRSRSLAAIAVIVAVSWTTGRPIRRAITNMTRNRERHRDAGAGQQKDPCSVGRAHRLFGQLMAGCVGLEFVTVELARNFVEPRLHITQKRNGAGRILCRCLQHVECRIPVALERLAQAGD